MKEKKLLIVERCDANLSQHTEEDDSIVLEGVFTTFNQKNRNGRIYESADFLPHVANLQGAIASRSLLGELDHPHNFETSLANASHVVESLKFDEQQNAIVGRIKLLHTSRGMDARALVKDGIPLHISSRAAGTVDESGRVRLQQLFTYDLVAEPGFANAVLTRVNEGVEVNPISDESKEVLKKLNESYQYMNENYKKIGEYDNVDVYEIMETNTELTPEIAQEGNKTVSSAEDQSMKNKDTLNNKNMDNNGQYILYSDFQKYSEHLSEVIADLRSAISNYETELANIKVSGDKTKPTQQYSADNVDNSMIADMVANQIKDDVDDTVEEKVAEKAEEMDEKYNNLVKYVSYLAEKLDSSISHQDHIAEEANKMIAHQDYLAENMNKMIAHQDYLAENMDKMIEHQDYLAENLDDTIGYQKYVAEMLDKSIDYSNMLAEEANKSIAHQDYLAENMNKMIAHQNHIVEESNKIIEYSNYLAEAMNSKYENVVNENGASVETTEVKEVEPVVENKVVEDPKFDAKKYQAELGSKLDSLIATVKTNYAEAKEKEAAALEESKSKINSTDFNLINYIPARLQESWMNLSDERKKEILAEAKMFIIKEEASAVYFWNTRDLREKRIESVKIVENVIPNENKEVSESVLVNDSYKMMAERIKRNMRKY
jgi:uncharacterized coiled-coil protein SlyX